MIKFAWKNGGWLFGLTLFAFPEFFISFNNNSTVSVIQALYVDIYGAALI